MQKVYDFIKEAGVYYLGTVDGDQPRIRPFGTINIFDGKLYFQTGKVKDCFKQMEKNPKVEIVAFKAGEWIRVTGIAVNDDRVEAKEDMLDKYPHLKAMYSATDNNTAVLYLKDAKAQIIGPNPYETSF